MWCASRVHELNLDEMKCNVRCRQSDLAQVRRRFSDMGQSHQNPTAYGGYFDSDPRLLGSTRSTCTWDVAMSEANLRCTTLECRKDRILSVAFE